MSDYDAFISFARWVNTTLDGVITVSWDKDKRPAAPYLHIAKGPVNEMGLQVSVMANLRLVVDGNDDEPVEETSGKLEKQILALLPKEACLEKYDTSDTSDRVIGTVIAKRRGMTPDLSPDNVRSEKIIAFELFTNSGI
jgi:hypothetical protein